MSNSPLVLLSVHSFRTHIFLLLCCFLRFFRQQISASKSIFILLSNYKLVLQTITENFIFDIFAILILSRSSNICILKQSTLWLKLLCRKAEKSAHAKNSAEAEKSASWKLTFRYSERRTVWKTQIRVKEWFFFERKRVL